MINLLHYTTIAVLIALFWPLGLAVAVPLAVGMVLVWLVTKLRQ